MDIFQSIILGVVQGFSEFLPISSSGHLVLAPWLFDWKDPGLTFDVALHFGTLIAVVVYFWKDWVRIISDCRFRTLSTGRQVSGWNSENNKSGLLWFLIAATIPGVLVGYFLNDFAEVVLRHPLLIAFNLIFFGLFLFLADKYFVRRKEVSQITLRDSILIGFAQALALLPGTSRSGITMTTGLALGLTRKSAAKFSFLMATPVIFGAAVYKLPDFLSSSFGVAEFLGIFAAAVSGYLAIAGLIKFVEKVSYKVFFWYRLALAIVIVMFWFVR